MSIYCVIHIQLYIYSNYGQNCEVTDGGGGDEPTVECPTDLLAEIQAEAQVQRDAFNICCRNLGGGFCTRLLEVPLMIYAF